MSVTREVVADEQQRRVERFGEGVRERITEIECAAMAHATAVSRSTTQREARLDYIDGGKFDAGFGEKPLEIVDHEQAIDRRRPARTVPASR